MPRVRFSPLDLHHEMQTLDNGLRVVVHEDRSSPIVAVHLMYHAGSKNERPGRTGLAHLLEHLLFEGSANCPKGEFDRLLEGVGGTNNGSTWLDRTNYYETVPTHGVELALWLERERMAQFLPVLDDRMLELQRGVVMNERRQSYENRPYGMADEKLQQLLFPPSDSYSWPTIGYMEDLEAITLADARDFFQTYYTPRNAVLVLAGDVSPAEGFRLAEEYFADVPAGPPLPAPGPTEEAIGWVPGAESIEDRVSFPRVYRAYRVPPFGSPEWIALDVLTYLLSDGESSRLQRLLVRELQVAQEADSFLFPTEVAGVFGIVATARSGVPPEKLTETIDGALRRVVEAGVGDDELVGAIRRARRDHIETISDVEGRAEELAYAATVLGDAGRAIEMLNDYASVTPDAVRTAAASYLTSTIGATVTVVPEEGGADALD